jgi:tagatose 6-phosphate kinase
MILTVTPNLAMDITYRLDELKVGATNRVRRVDARAGGKGVNVARVLRSLGADALVTGLVGGATGRAAVDELDRAGIAHQLTPIAGETRKTVTCMSEVDGDATIINEPGPAVTEREWDDLCTRVRDLAVAADIVVLSGSLPPGAPVDGYVQLVELAAAQGIPALLDSSGGALAEGLAARPAIVKPNLTELTALTGESDPAVAARTVRQRFGCAVVASLGSAGLLADTDEGVFLARPPEVVRGNPIGAGDACVAAVASGIAEHSLWRQRIAHAVALSAAAVRCPLAGDVDLDYYRAHREHITVEVTP